MKTSMEFWKPEKSVKDAMADIMAEYPTPMKMPIGSGFGAPSEYVTMLEGHSDLAIFGKDHDSGEIVCIEIVRGRHRPVWVYGNREASKELVSMTRPWESEGVER